MFTLMAASAMTQLVPFAIFGMFAVGAWMILELLAAHQPRAEERLEELRNPAKRRSGAALHLESQ